MTTPLDVDRLERFLDVMLSRTRVITGKDEAKVPPQQNTFPSEVIKQLSGSELRILEELSYLCRLRARKSPTGARYCYPSEMYLAKKIGLARENVSRHICKLSRLGILEVTHRRKVRQRYQTNLYRIRNWKWWRLASILKKASPQPHHVTTSSHKAIPMREINSPPLSETGQNLVNGILERWRLRASPS